MATEVDRGRIPVTAVTIAAITAVAFWSLKPIFISMIGDRAGYAEVYLVAGGISVLTSALVSGLLWKQVVAVARGGRRAFIGLANACVSGLFLGIWYYGFYRALYGADKADATIIAFTWPMIAVIAMRIFSPKTADRLKWHQWLLILASFAGAVAVGLSGLGETGTSGASGEIVWAFVAAIGSGLYLPFAINATNAFDDLTGSKPIATFFSISVANVAALIAVASSLKAADHTLRFYAFDAEVVGICAMIGIGTYLIAEVTWTWAFREYKSLTLSSLPYFSPAVSVVLLFLLFNEVVRPVAVLGLVVILFSNLTLHARHRSTNALSLTLIATVFVALGAQVLPTKIDGPIGEMAAAVTGLFAILAGFILARAAGRRTEEVDARAVLVRRVMGLDRTTDHDRADLILRRILELEFERDSFRQDDRVLELYKLLDEETDDVDDAARQDAVDAFSSWNTMRMDRLSLGEWAALWTTGLGSILFVLLLRGESVLGNIGAVLFSAGALLAIFTIFDYDRNNIHGFSGRLDRVQQSFRQIGKDPYIPNELLESGELSTKHLRPPIRTSVGGDDDTVREATTPSGAKTFNILYLSIAALVIVGVLVLPMTGVGRVGADFVSGPRPFAGTASADAADDETRASIVIADPHWSSASVIAELIKRTLGSSFGGVAIERVDQADLEVGFGTGRSAYTVHPDLWLENQGPALRRRVETNEVRLNQEPYTGLQGVYTLDSVGTARALTRWEDLRRGDVAAQFDTDGDGLAEVWIGQDNWPSTQILRDWFDRQKGLKVEVETYPERMFQARLKREANQPADGRSPLLFYSYEPGAIHGEFHPRRLTGAPFDDGCAERSAECRDDVTVHIAWTARLAEKHPAAARILGRMALSRAEVSDLVKSVEIDGVSPADVASDWMKAHPDRVAQWRGPDGQ